MNIAFPRAISAFQPPRRQGTASSATAGLIEVALKVQAIRHDTTLSSQERDGQIKQLAPLAKGAVQLMRSEADAAARADFIQSADVGDDSASTASASTDTADPASDADSTAEGARAAPAPRGGIDEVEYAHPRSRPAGQSAEQAKGRVVRRLRLTVCRTDPAHGLAPCPAIKAPAPGRRSLDVSRAALPAVTARQPVDSGGTTRRATLRPAGTSPFGSARPARSTPIRLPTLPTRREGPHDDRRH